MSNRLAHVLDAKWRSEDVNINEERDFSFLRLDERILAGLSNAGYRIPSPIQLEAIPLCLSGGDVFIQAKTGTGKTLIFSVLAVAAVSEIKDPQVLIVTPSREGVHHICRTIYAIGSHVKDLNCEGFIGGMCFADDILKARDCKIAVGTPGRIIHLIHKEILKFDTINLFMVDDFDELHKAMIPEFNVIFNILPEGIQTVLTSLACTDEVMESASKYLKHSFQACFNENELSLLGMAHYYCIVPVNSLPVLSYRMKLEILKGVLLKVKFSQCIIFCNSVHRTEILCVDIQNMGLSVASISKAMHQVERLQAVELLKENRCKVFVSTDVCSRGLDAENVDLVINFDMPDDCLIYLRRCGRAGRYGARCSSVTFLTKDQRYQFAEIKKIGHFDTFKLPDPIPEDLNSEGDIKPNITKGNSISSSTEFNKKTINNMKKMKARGAYSRPTVNGNKETNLDGVEDFSVVIAHESENQTIDLEIVSINHFMENDQDITKIKANETCLHLSNEKNVELLHGSEIFNTHQPLGFEKTEVFNEECESKKCELNSCETPNKTEADAEYTTNDIFNLSDFEILSDVRENFDSRNNHSKDCAVVSCESKSLPLDKNLESLITSGRETMEIESIQHSKKNDSENEDSSFEEIDLFNIQNCAKKV